MSTAQPVEGTVQQSWLPVHPGMICRHLELPGRTLCVSVSCTVNSSSCDGSIVLCKSWTAKSRVLEIVMVCVMSVVTCDIRLCEISPFFILPKVWSFCLYVCLLVRLYVCHSATLLKKKMWTDVGGKVLKRYDVAQGTTEYTCWQSRSRYGSMNS